MHTLRLCVWLALLTAIFAPLERLFALHDQKLFRRQIAIDVTYYFLSSLLPSFLIGVPLAAVAWGVHQIIPPAFTSSVAAWPAALRIAAALIIGDLGFYWGHRLSHEIPFLWRFHAIHHSSEELDFLSNTRAHPVDMVFTRLCGLVPLYMLGLAAPVRNASGLVPLLVLLVGTSWGFFVHANLKLRLGWIESLISTPAFHHWHHTNDGPAYINKNYAPLLPWVDRLFGTFYLPQHSTPQSYGIDQKLAEGIIPQLWEPFRPIGNQSPEPALQNVPEAA